MISSSSPRRNSSPYLEMTPCPVMPSHSASRSVHCTISSCKPGFRFDGAHHLTRLVKLSNSGATLLFSAKSLKTNARVLAALTRSNSGPRAAVFFDSARPTRPLTRDVINHGAASACHLTEALCVSHTSKLLVGRILSFASKVTRPARYTSSATKAAQFSSIPMCVAIIFKSRTPRPPARSASAGSCAQYSRISSAQRKTVATFAIAAS